MPRCLRLWAKGATLCARSCSFTTITEYNTSTDSKQGSHILLLISKTLVWVRWVRWVRIRQLLYYYFAKIGLLSAHMEHEHYRSASARAGSQY